MTVIQIRGTSGSGKSTVMRQVMKGLGGYAAHHVTGRKRPLLYAFNEFVYVLGHYESACGGCDTIGSARAIYELTERLFNGPDNAKVVLQEGLLLSEDVKWTSQIRDVHCYFLTTPIEICIEQIKTRRSEAGNDKPLNESNSRKRVAVIERARVKLVELGVDCVRVSPSQAANSILNRLRLHAQKGT